MGSYRTLTTTCYVGALRDIKTHWYLRVESILSSNQPRKYTSEQPIHVFLPLSLPESIQALVKDPAESWQSEYNSMLPLSNGAFNFGHSDKPIEERQTRV
jgi:hypothetical protein